MVRNTLKYVANKDMKTFAKDLKTIYTAANEESARKQLEAVTRKWSGQYPSAMNRWNDNWDINVNIKMYIFDHLRMYIFAILPLDRYIFLSDKIFL